MNNDSVKTLKGIGDKTGRLLSVLGVDTVEDLVGYYPARFIPYPEISLISEAADGQDIAISGYVMGTPKTIRAGRLKITSVTVEDISGKLKVVWYNSPYIAQSVKRDEEYVFAGKYTVRRTGAALEHPIVYRREEYDRIAGKYKPVYRLVKGLNQKTIEKAVQEALKVYEFSEDWLPVDMRERYDLLTEEAAVKQIHTPDSSEQIGKARRRLVFGEFFSFLYSIKQMKKTDRINKSRYVIDTAGIYEKYVSQLPFKLTESQERSCREILADLSGGRIMNRLLQGDVGSGKTVVALMALYAVFMSGYQGAIMVPTEVLANQHYRTAVKIFDSFEKKPDICLVTGSMTASEKKKVYDRIRNHEADIIIGTHALIQEGTVFDNLALVITDEQHRFGVRQREALSEKGNRPHILVMSATPIPRTLAVIMYGDLDISVIDTKPVGRLPVKNAVIGEKDRNKAYKHILGEVRSGHQAYIICPMVEESETVDAENVTEYIDKIRTIFPQDIVVQYLHGRMKQSEKDSVMSAFAAGETDILVSTTVVEVGVDVPNATVMMIENAERYGLAALHQLRGRVGRGDAQSYAIFVRTSDSDIAKQRLDVIGSSNDGFYIASEDLRLRGPGEILGSEQSGQMRFELGDIYADSDILKDAYDACTYADSEEFKPDDEEIIRMKKHINDFMNSKLNNLNI